MPTTTPSRRFKLTRLIALIAFIVGLSGGLYLLHKVQVQRNAGALLQRADAAAEQGQWADAAKLYQSYVNFRPQDAEAFARYATTLEELAKAKPSAVQDLLKVYEKLLLLEPTRTEARKKVIVHHLALGSYTSVRQHLDYLKSAPEAGPPTALLYEQLATCDEKERKYPQAVANYDTAIALGKADPESYLRLALILRNDINTPEAHDRAEDVINAVIAAYPNDVRSRIARAKYRVRTGEPTKARDDVEFAYRSLPGGNADPDVALALAELATNDLELKTARVALEAAAKGTPDDNRLPLAMARVLVRLKNPDEAKSTLRESATRATRPDLTLVRIAETLLDLGDSTTPAAVAEKFAADPAMKFFADYLNARTKLAQSNWPEALSLFDAAIRGGLNRYPEQLLHSILGQAECHALANNPDRRLKSYEEALLIDRTSLAAQVGRADGLAATGKTADAKKAYSQLVAQSPVARLGYCQILFDEYLANPTNSNRTLLDESFGPTPYSIEVALLRSRFLIAQGKLTDAIAFLDNLVKSAPDNPVPRVAFALAKARQNLASGIAALDLAERDLGDHSEIRLARAQLLIRLQNPDVPAIVKLGENVRGNDRERYRLLAELGDLLGQIGRWKEATDLLLRASAEMPFDVNTRAAVFWLAMETRDLALQDRMLDQLKAIEGADGPFRTVTEATRTIRDLKPGETARIKELRTKLNELTTKRATWGRVYALLGDLDILDGNPEAATDRYREAVRFGGLSESVVRTHVRLLLERNGQAEALDVLNRFARTNPLPGDLAGQLIRLKGQFGEDTDKTLAWARSPEAQKAQSYKDHLIRAGVLSAGGFPDEAQAALYKAVGLDLDGKGHDAWVYLVQFLVGTQQLEKAQAAIVEATKRLKPASEAPADKAALLIALGDCHDFVGDFKAARDHFQRAVAIAPSDRLAVGRLVQALTANGQRADAEAILGKLLASSAPTNVKLWGRRELAYSKVNGPDGFAELGPALAFIEENLRDGGNLVEDQRAKALILAINPYRQKEAIDLLLETKQRSPLSPDQNYQLARMYVQQSRMEDAESALKEATRATAIAAPSHLGLLVRVLILEKKTNEARTAAMRLKEIAPKSWDAVAAEARVLVVEGNKSEAGRRILAASETTDTTPLVAVVGPFLEELGCAAEAEKVYEKVAQGKAPTAHAPLGSWYNRSGQAVLGAKLAFDHEKTAPIGVTARLLAGAARCRPRATVPAAERPDWEKTLENIDAWMTATVAANPKNAEVLFAKAELDDLFARYDDEIRGYERALAIDPNNDIFLNNIATVLALVKNDGSDATLRYVERAMLRRGPVASYLDTQALVHMAGNRFDLAVNDLTIAINLDPRPVFYYHRALAYHRLVEQRPDDAQRRDQDWTEARRRGFAEAMLHPAELVEFKKFVQDVPGK